VRRALRANQEAVQDPFAVQGILAHLASFGRPRAARPRPTRARRTQVARGSAPLSTLPLTRAGASPGPAAAPSPAS
jgi:hypothetical protein